MIDQEKLTQLILSGLSVKETVKKGFALGTVKQYRRKLLGKTFRKPVDYDRVDKMLLKGEDVEYIASELGISSKTVHARIAKLRQTSKIIRDAYKARGNPDPPYDYKAVLDRAKQFFLTRNPNWTLKRLNLSIKYKVEKPHGPMKAKEYKDSNDKPCREWFFDHKWLEGREQ